MAPIGFLALLLVAVSLNLIDARGPFIRLPSSGSNGAAISGGGSAFVEQLSPEFAPPKVWPMPVKYDRGNVTLAVDRELQWDSNLDSVVLSSAFKRYNQLIFTHSKGKSKRAKRAREGLPLLKKVKLIVHSKDESLQLGTDESYSLTIPDNGDDATIEAYTVYGALHAIETFSQLCAYHFTKHTVELAGAPWKVEDKPRFQHRGLLIDTGRHWQPLATIKGIIESLSYAKMNVLHWHMVDTQSFPIEVPSFPLLWKGSYTPAERYTVEDLKEVVEFARLHGVMVMAEFDVPGHAQSWGVGYPELWPSASCLEPLDVSSNFTFELIDGLLKDMAEVFPYKLVHLGGDEVNTDCWSGTERVQQWLTEQNMTTHDAYADFVLRAQKIAVKHGWEPVNWEEPFDEFPDRLHNKTVVHVWLNKATTLRAVASGRRVLVSNQDKWYLDHLGTSWADFYLNEPTEGISDPEQKKLVLGGEVCMWGETVDASNMQQTAWPRAAAAAERLWSQEEHLEVGLETALPRLEHFRCLLNRRGVRATPITNVIGRMAPLGPGSCYAQ